MSASLTATELDVVWRLHDTGLQLQAATLAVVMVTRQHARPERELGDIVRQYQNLENPVLARQACQDLKDLGWLIESKSYGQALLHQAPDLRDRIATKLGDPDLANRLLQLRSSLEPYIRILGPMNDESVYASFHNAIRSAQTEICLPMLATTPNLAAVPILQERARAGVHVRILLGSPGVVSTLRGRTMAGAARQAIHGWAGHAAGIPEMEVRVSHYLNDVLLSSSMSVDGRLLRLDVYDPAQQRTLEGVMLQVECPPGLTLNLLNVFQLHFDGAWQRAAPVGTVGQLWWRASRSWQWLAFGAFAIATSATARDPVWVGILGSVAATFLVNAMVGSWPTLRSLWRRGHA